MKKTLAETLKDADPDLLDEILREAESRLSAQLTTAIAADTRAMTFLGFISAVAVATVGAGLATYTVNQQLGTLALFVGLGFIASAFFAFQAARPNRKRSCIVEKGYFKRRLVARRKGRTGRIL